MRSSKSDWLKTVERAVSRPRLMGWRVCPAVLVVRAESVLEDRLDTLGTRSRWWSSQTKWCVIAPRCAASAVSTSALSQAASQNAVKSCIVPVILLLSH